MASSERTSAPPPERVSNRVISADRVVGVMPWTIGGFDRPDAPAATPVEEDRVRAEHLPTADEVAAIERQAHGEGFRAGLAEGIEVNQRIVSLLTGVSESVARMEREMAQTLVKVAVDLARQIVRESISVRPELLVPIVHDALAGIARTVDPGAVYVNPEDLPIVTQRLGEALEHAGWRPFADEHVERGGCRLEFAGGEVDATVATRWNRVMAQLERDDAWLE